MFMLAIAPFAFWDLSGSIVLIAFLAALTKGAGLAIIPVIILTNLIIQRANMDSGQLEKELSQELEGNAVHDGHIVSDVSQTLHFSAYTSWIINTVVVKSTRKIQLRSSIVATIGYSLLIITFITFEALTARNSIQNYSVLFCIPDNWTSHSSIETQIWFNSTRALVAIPTNTTSSNRIVRVCNEHEQPTTVLWSIIFPVACLAVIVKLMSNFVLSGLSNYQRLVTFLESMHLDTFHYAHVIEYPEQYRSKANKLFDYLCNNIDVANRQHRLNGKTIMHVAQDLHWSEYQIRRLQTIGAKVDIEDFEGLRAVNELRGEEEEEGQGGSPVEGNTFNFLIWFIEEDRSGLFSKFVILGSRVDGKGCSGRTALDYLVDKIIMKNEEDFFDFLKFLSYKDVLEILVKLAGMSFENKEQLMLSIYQSQSNIKKETYFLSKFKSGTAYAPMANFFQEDEPEGILAELAQIQFDTDYKQIEQLLHFASKFGQAKLVRRLLECNYDPDFRDRFGETPLHVAIRDGKFPCVSVLLEFNADHKAKSYAGETPLDLARALHLNKPSQEGLDQCIQILESVI